MRLRFRSITYAVGGTSASLERHYRELRESMLRAGAHYGLQTSSPWRPPIDIHETPDAILVKIELAGIGEDDINITLYDNALVVTGHRENDITPDESVYYHEAQVRYGPFRADVLLPLPVDQDAVQATYEHGFLRVRLPKAGASAAQRIEASGGVRENSQAEGRAEHDTEHEGDSAAPREVEVDNEDEDDEVEALKAATAAANVSALPSAQGEEEPAGASRGSSLLGLSGESNEPR